MLIRGLTNTYTIDDTLTSIKITINGVKDRFMFSVSFYLLIFHGFCTSPFLALLVGVAVQKSLSRELAIIVEILIFALWAYVIFTRFQEALDLAFDKEIIVIDSQIIRIEKYILGLKRVEEYSSENIYGITLAPPPRPRFNLFRRYPSTNFDTLMLWHRDGRIKFHTFGKGLPFSSNQTVLGIILSRFPQYMYEGVT